MVVRKNVYHPILHYSNRKADSNVKPRYNVKWEPQDGMNAWKPSLVVSLQLLLLRHLSHLQKRPLLLCQGCYTDTHLIKDCAKFALKSFSHPLVKSHLKLLTRVAQTWYEAERITEVEVEKANVFVEMLARRLSAVLDRNITFKPFGSLISGFGAKNADLDLCMRWKKKNEKVSQRVVELTFPILLQQQPSCRKKRTS